MLGTPDPSCESSTTNNYCGELTILNADWKNPAAYLPGDVPVYIVQFDLSSFNYVLLSSNSYDILIIAGVAPATDPQIEINTLTADTVEPRQPDDHWFFWIIGFVGRSLTEFET